MNLNFNNTLKFFLPFSLSIFFAGSFFSQKIEVGPSNSPEWENYYKDSLIQIDYRFDNCNLKYDGINKDEVYLKIQNLKNEKVEISWELVLNYDTRCYNCNSENDELKFNTVLDPYQVLEGKCEEANLFELKIFSKFLNSESDTKLKSFSIKYLTAKTISERWKQ